MTKKRNQKRAAAEAAATEHTIRGQRVLGATEATGDQVRAVVCRYRPTGIPQTP